MLAARDGSLWIVFRPGKLSRLRDGHVTSYSGIPLAATLVEGSDGTIIAATANGLLRFRDGVWKDAGKEWGFPGRLARHVYYDKSGTLWVFTGDRVVYLPAGESRFVDAGKTGGGGDFAQAPDGAIWLADTGRSAHTVRRPRDLSPMTEVRVGATAVLFDRNGSLWISSAGDGLRRVAYPDRIDGHAIAQYGPEAEQFSAKDGLSGDYVHCLMEDREGNIWSGTSRGLDRFRESTFTPVSVDHPDAPRGFTAGPPARSRLHRPDRASQSASRVCIFPFPGPRDRAWLVPNRTAPGGSCPNVARADLSDDEPPVKCRTWN